MIRFKFLADLTFFPTTDALPSPLCSENFTFNLVTAAVDPFISTTSLILANTLYLVSETTKPGKHTGTLGLHPKHPRVPITHPQRGMTKLNGKAKAKYQATHGYPFAKF